MNITHIEYNNNRNHIKWILRFIALCWGMMFLARGVPQAGPMEERLTRSTLERVEAIARHEKSLEKFGKSTLAESAVLLDLSSQSIKGLLEYLEKKQSDWKARFWAVDMLGYVGNASAVYDLYKIAKSPGEKLITRKQAVLSLKQIAEREPENKEKVLGKVKRLEKIIGSRRYGGPSQ